MEEIYNKYNKHSFWQEALDRVFDKVLADVSLGHYFAGKDMAQIKSMHNLLLETALTNEDIHFPVSLSRVHKPLQISNQTFERFVKIYESALQEALMTDSDIEAIISILISFKTNIVSN